MADFNFSGDRSGARMDDLLTEKRLYLIGRHTTPYTIDGSTEEWITEEISLEENTYYIIDIFMGATCENAGDLLLGVTSSGINEGKGMALTAPNADPVFSAIAGSFDLMNLGNSNNAGVESGYFATGCIRTGSSPTFRISYDPTGTTGAIYIHNFVMTIKKATDTYQLP